MSRAFRDMGLTIVPIIGTIVPKMSIETLGPASVLFGRTRANLLRLLFGQTDKQFYLRQLARELQSGIGALQRELKQLTNAGFIVRRKIGNQVFYQANTGSPTFSDLKALVAKTV